MLLVIPLHHADSKFMRTSTECREIFAHIHHADSKFMRTSTERREIYAHVIVRSVIHRTLRQELEKERHFQHQFQGKPQCTCCERKLGIIFNSGAPCPSCLYRVCKQCRVMSHKPPPPFLCPVCVKKRSAMWWPIE